MLGKTFGFLKIQDEHSIMDAFIEHSKVYSEELDIIIKMISFSCTIKPDGVEALYQNIRKINEEALEVFKHTSEQIVQANFDLKKQYDLLRLYQRMENISEYLIATGKRILILAQIGGCISGGLETDIKNLALRVKDILTQFHIELDEYGKKQGVLQAISKVKLIENDIDHLRALCLKTAYKQANEGHFKMGTFRSITDIIEHLENTADVVEEAALSIEWLLFY